MFGMLGTFLPAAAGVLIASNPVLLGIGAVFGGMGLADDRRRKIAARRRQRAPRCGSSSTTCSFEMGNQIGNLVREIQRDLRDDFSDRIAELMRTYTETAQRAQADLQSRGRSANSARRTRRRSLASFASLDSALTKVAL